MSLPPDLKCTVDFIHDKCDNSGVWEINMSLLNTCVKPEKPVTIEQVLSIDGGSQFKKITGRKIYCVGFISFQYVELSSKCVPHQKILGLINKHNFDYLAFDRVPTRVQEEDKEEEEEVDKEKEKEEPKILNLTVERNIQELKTDQYFHELVCMALSIEMQYVLKMIDQFILEKKIGNELEKSLSQCQTHFRDWLKIEIKKAKKNDNSTRNPSTSIASSRIVTPGKSFGNLREYRTNGTGG